MSETKSEGETKKKSPLFFSNKKTQLIWYKHRNARATDIGVIITLRASKAAESPGSSRAGTL
jgi:hypothetical protein